MQVTKTAYVTATGTITVTVSEPASRKGYVDIPVTASASWNSGTVGPFNVVIDWGDGKSETFTKVSVKNISKSHTYTAAGSYVISVAVSDEYTGSSGAGTRAVQVVAQLSASLSASPTSGVIPLAVTFTMGASGGFTPYTATLAYGDGASDSVTVPGTKAHTYTKVGTYTATLTVTDALGAAVYKSVTTLAEMFLPWLPDWVAPLAGLVPVLVVGVVVGANELQKARVWG